MRRRIALGLLAVPASLLAFSNGCSSSSEAPVESVCQWLWADGNCYQAFFNDIQPRTCGNVGRGSAPKGSFLTRDKLDVCVLDGGGQVLFDPPVTVDQFPLQTVSFKIVNADGTECGKASYSGPYSFSITVDPVVAADGGGLPAGVSRPIVGGTYSQTKEPDVDLYDTTCPNGEQHRFNFDETPKCTSLTPVIPHGEIESSAGGIDPIAGYVRFRAYFPPATGKLEGATPSVVEYFDCAVPPAPKPCVDGVQDGTETDVDCGGTCAAKCAADQKCLRNEDCQSGSCQFQAGLKKCVKVEAGAGGAGGGG
jgi:hypothetical protein